MESNVNDGPDNKVCSRELSSRPDGSHCSRGGNLDCEALSFALSFSYSSIRDAYVGILLA